MSQAIARPWLHRRAAPPRRIPAGVKPGAGWPVAIVGTGGDPAIPRNPHFFITSPTSTNALVRTIAQGAQRQIARFFASDGSDAIHPEPTRFFEMPPAEPLSEDLNFVR